METVSNLVLTIVVNALWEVTLVAFVASLCARLLRNAPARYRHLIWVLALGLSVALPMASMQRGWLETTIPTFMVDSSQGMDPGKSLARAAAAPLPASTGNARGRAARLMNSFAHKFGFLQGGTRSVSLSPNLVWSVLLGCGVWLPFHLGRLGRAWQRTQRIARKACPCPLMAGMASAAALCRASLNLPAVPILRSSEIAGPITLGARHPVIILPDSLFFEATSEELTSVFAHEMAHILRRDFLMNMIYELVTLPVSFHPAITIIKRRINETRELACDDIAADCLASPPDYARSLVALAARISAPPALSRSGYSLGVFDANILEERIMKILDQQKRISPRLSKLLLTMGACLLAASCILASAFSLGISQEKQASTDDALRAFVGTWQAKLMGRPYVIVALDPAGHKLGGKVSSYHVRMDDTGNPAGVSEGPEVCTVTDSKLDEKILTLSTDCPGGITRRFSLKLTGDRELNLEMAGAPPSPEESGGLKLTKEEEESGELPPEVKPFLGVWQASFQGKPFMTLHLASEGEKFVGTLSPYRIALDADGKLTEAEPNDQGKGWHIVGAHFDGVALTLRATEDGSEDVDQFEMELTDSNAANFIPLGTPMRVDAWKMTRGTSPAPRGSTATPPSSGIDGGVASATNVSNASQIQQSQSTTASQKIYQIGDGVTPPTRVYTPNPSYTRQARKDKLQGVVTLSILINPQGEVSDVRVVKPLGGGLDENSVETVRTWKFNPALRNGVPVPVHLMIQVRFLLH